MSLRFMTPLHTATCEAKDWAQMWEQAGGQQLQIDISEYQLNDRD